MGKATTATKVTLDEVIAENAQIKENVEMDKIVSDQEQIADALQVASYMKSNVKLELAKELVVRDVQIDYLRAMIAELKATPTKEDEVVAELEPTKEQKKARAIARMKATKARNKALKEQAEAEANAEPEPEIIVVPESDTKAKQEPADTATKLVVAGYCSCPDCIATNKFCTGVGTKWVAKDGKLARELWFEKHVQDVAKKLDKQVKAGEITKAKAKKLLALHVLVAGKSS